VSRLSHSRVDTDLVLPSVGGYALHGGFFACQICQYGRTFACLPTESNRPRERPRRSHTRIERWSSMDGSAYAPRRL
jgi:hypothetical protein